MNPPSDAELFVAIRNQDAQAMETLLLRHAPMVLRFARSMCHHPSDAEDVAQEALIVAARALQNLREEAALSSWLYAVTRSFCRKSARRRKGAPADFTPIDADSSFVTAHDPENLASDRELSAALELAMRGLDPKLRSVLVLRDVEGLSAPEVAAALSLELATVKTRLHRGRAAMRAKIAPLLAPSPERQASCPEVVERFSRYLEGEVGAVECQLMHAHVDQCPACNAACASLRRTIALCRDAGAHPPVDIQERVQQALRVVTAR